jgi:hypothetical protein
MGIFVEAPDNSIDGNNGMSFNLNPSPAGRWGCLSFCEEFLGMNVKRSSHRENRRFHFVSN